MGKVKVILDGSIKPQEVINMACTMCHVNKKILLSSSREGDIMVARRFVTYYLGCNGFSRIQIGKILNRNHSSITYLFSSMICFLKNEEQLRKEYDNFLNLLKN